MHQDLLIWIGADAQLGPRMIVATAPAPLRGWRRLFFRLWLVTIAARRLAHRLVLRRWRTDA